MISLEEEARVSGRKIEDVAYERRFHATIKDFFGDAFFFGLGTIGGLVSFSAAHYYRNKDAVNFWACSTLATFSTIVAVKSLFELGRLGITSIRTMVSGDRKILEDYLETKYPNPSLLSPVLVDEDGRRKY